MNFLQEEEQEEKEQEQRVVAGHFFTPSFLFFLCVLCVLCGEVFFCSSGGAG